MHRLVRTTLLALALGVTGFGVSQSNILTCSVNMPPELSCSYERVGWQLMGLEGGVGAVFRVEEEGEPTLAPFTVLGYYGERHAWWVEVTTPQGVIPVIGNDPQWLSVGMEYRW